MPGFLRRPMEVADPMSARSPNPVWQAAHQSRDQGER